MGSMSLFHWIIVLVVVVVLFGAGKIPRLAEDLAKGIKAFRHGMREEDKPEAKPELPPSDKPPVP
jgi:sec-independent protein translocase protein TatA